MCYEITEVVHSLLYDLIYLDIITVKVSKDNPPRLLINLCIITDKEMSNLGEIVPQYHTSKQKSATITSKADNLTEPLHLTYS